MNHSRYALILAGGSGTRFWPLSRDARPKQLLDLFGRGTLLRLAFDRLKGLIPPENVFVLTNCLQVEEVRRQLKEVPSENIVSEPLRRDTAPAVTLGVALVASRCPDASMLVIPSDQLISDDVSFRLLAEEALSLSEREKALITIGIKPTWACPSYGYIERGRRLEDEALSHACYEVRHFREKPDRATAERYLAEGGYTWNAGMFIWSVPQFRHELEACAPELAAFVDGFVAAQDVASYLEEEFLKLMPISIDYAVMEKASRVLNFESSFDWDDVGSWISVGKYMDDRGEGNVSNGELSAVRAINNIAYSTQGRRIALLGVENLIVVDTGDALLVADRSAADSIKDLVKELPEELK